MVNRGTTVLCLLTSAVSAALGTQAQAQESESDAAPVEIVVTGSRLPSRNLTAAAPVTILDRAEIEATGAASIGELLREMPVATASASESAGRGNNGSANVALRGLSAVNTLVLINGRRVLANSAGGTVDLNSIPFEAIERVEVLQDGASAIYGSDAIAGVVNIIMRRSFDGLQINGGYGVSSRGDLPNREVSVTFGQTFDRSSFLFVGGYRNADGNVIADRPISRDPDWRSLGGRNFRDPMPTRTAFKGIDPDNPDREMIIREGVTQATSIDDFRDFIFPGTNTPLDSGNDGINYWEYESSASDISTRNLWFYGNYELTDGISAFVEATYNNRRSLGFLAPDYFGEAYGDTVIVSANNDYNPFGRDLSAARTIIEQPRSSWRQNRINANTYRLVTGLEGTLGGWRWDVSYNYQRLDQSNYGGKGVLRERLRQAAGDSDACRAAGNGCVPINLFGAEGSITQEMLDFISADIFSRTDAELTSAVANISGTLFSLPAGDVNAAFGVEYRTESFAQNNDSFAEVNAFVARGLAPDAFPPTRKVKEVYAETAIPILTDRPFARSLDLEAAVRYSHYNAFGDTVNPKFGLKWRPVESLLLRASWGTGFRAPNFTEAYSAQTRGFRSIVDPCLGDDYASYPGCNGRQATTTVTGAWVITGGNPDLEPEEAKNLTVGAVITPSFLPRLSLTIDYYRITKDDIIGTADVNYLIMQNALYGTYADRIVRDANNYVFEVIATRDNLLNQEIKGFDVGVQYETADYGWGSLLFRVDATYLDSLAQSPAPDVPPIEYVGTYTNDLGTLAKYRGTGRITWTRNDLSATWGMRYVGSVTNMSSLLVNGRHLEADDYLQNDLVVSYDLTRFRSRITLGIENIFDEMPPFLEGNYANGFDQLTFNSRGRFFFFRFAQSL